MIKSLYILNIDKWQEILHMEKDLEQNSAKGTNYQKNIKIIAKYQSNPMEGLTPEILFRILLNAPRIETKSFFCFRMESSKICIRTLSESDENLKYFLVILLTNSDSVELAKIILIDELQLLEQILQDPSKLSEFLEHFYKKREDLMVKLENKELLTKDISSIANKLIDESKFEEAQDYIKLAKEIPEKFLLTYKRAQEEMELQNYKAAEKSYSTCLSFAEKFENPLLSTYLQLKMENTSQILPSQKELKNIISTIKRDFGKAPIYLPYSQQIDKLNRSVEILDNFEEDEQISVMNYLIDHLIQASEVLEKLMELDLNIRNDLAKL